MRALDVARTFRPDLVVLDVMMPGMDGFGVLRRLRADGILCPTLFLTARDAVEDKVTGLTLAAGPRRDLPGAAASSPRLRSGVLVGVGGELRRQRVRHQLVSQVGAGELRGPVGEGAQVDGVAG